MKNSLHQNALLEKNVVLYVYFDSWEGIERETERKIKRLILHIEQLSCFVHNLCLIESKSQEWYHKWLKLCLFY